MTTLPEASIGLEEDMPLGPPGLWMRARALVGEKLSYALADQVTYSFGNMVVAALISRHCYSREFGIYILTQRAMDVLIQFSNVFLWSPYTFNMLGKTAERQRVFLGSIVAQQVVGCLLGAVGLWVLSRWASTPERGMYYGVFAPLVFSSMGILFREFTRRFYFSHMRFAEAFWTDVATVALQIAGVEGLYLAGKLTVPNTLWVLSAGAIAVSLWWLVREWTTFVVSVRATLVDFAENAKLGRWLLGSNMLYMVSAQCNPWVLGSVLGATSVGAYAKCEQVVNVPRVALTSLQNTMAPTMARGFAEGGRPKLREIVKRFDRVLLLGSIVFAVGIVLLGPWVTNLVFRQPPGNARMILLFLAMNFVAFAATMAQSYGLTVVGKVSQTVYANVIGLVAQVVASVLLIRTLHEVGAALAMLIGSVVVLAVRQVYYSREMAAA